MPTNKKKSNLPATTEKQVESIYDKYPAKREGYYVTEDGPFATSRKNKVGLGIAAGVVGLQIVSGGLLGFLWPVVALSGWAAGALLTPAKQIYIPPKPLAGPTELYDGIGKQLKTLRKKTKSSTVLKAFTEFQVSCRWVLEHWRRLDSAPSQQALVRSIIEDHIPELVAAYLDVTDIEQPAAKQAFVDSVNILRGEVDEIREAIEQDSVRHLRDHSLALKLQYGDEIPGIESTPNVDGGSGA